MNIVIDMDNTLADEQGATKRPGIDELLAKLQAEGHTLILWTNSARYRAIIFLKDLDLRKYFEKIICREDYDPNNKGILKDIRLVDGDILIDDNPKEISHMKTIKKKAYWSKPTEKI